MKLGTFAVATPLGAQRCVGVETTAGIVDATAARIALLEQTLPARAAERIGAAQVPADLIEVIALGKTGLDWVAEAVEQVLKGGSESTSQRRRTLYKPSEITLLAPIPRPPGIICSTTWEEHIRNAEAHGAIVHWPPPGSPLRGYYKANCDSVSAAGVDIEIPPYATDDVDVECELAAIVGTGGKNLSIEAAEKAIAGYCIFNDVSIRKRQRDEMQLGLGPTKGKDQDGGNIMGPWLVTADEVGNVRDLTMSLHVNGEEWSSMGTGVMAYTLAEMLSYLSQGQTVHPGQVITSGSYPGGCALDLGRKLKRGDKVELRISRLGSLANQIAAA